MSFFTPRNFLIYGGIVLLALGLVGFTGIFSETGALKTTFYLDNGENVAHTALGIIALAIVFVPGLNTALEPYYRWIVALLGVVALFFAVYGVIQINATAPNTFGISNLEPLDDVIHIVVAAWAGLSVWGRSARSATA